jgi:hypothetical protein
MATTMPALSATCPLCGAPVLAVNGLGQVESDDVHPVALGRYGNAGYTLCDSCGVLTDLPTNLTLN